MVQLLVDHRETLKLGDVMAVGDLFDVVAHGDEAFGDMAIHFDNAKRLYHQRTAAPVGANACVGAKMLSRSATTLQAAALRNDDRLVKTLLLSALVPEVDRCGTERREAGRLDDHRDDPHADPRQGPGGVSGGAGPGRPAWVRSGSARRSTPRSACSFPAWIPRAVIEQARRRRITRATASAGYANALRPAWHPGRG